MDSKNCVTWPGPRASAADGDGRTSLADCEPGPCDRNRLTVTATVHTFDARLLAGHAWLVASPTEDDCPGCLGRDEDWGGRGLPVQLSHSSGGGLSFALLKTRESPAACSLLPRANVWNGACAHQQSGGDYLAAAGRGRYGSGARGPRRRAARREISAWGSVCFNVRVLVCVFCVCTGCHCVRARLSARVRASMCLNLCVCMCVHIVVCVLGRKGRGGPSPRRSSFARRW